MQYLERAEMADLLGTYLPTKFCLSNSCNYLLLGLATVVVVTGRFSTQLTEYLRLTASARSRAARLERPVA